MRFTAFCADNKLTKSLGLNFYSQTQHEDDFQFMDANGNVKSVIEMEDAENEIAPLKDNSKSGQSVFNM